MGTAKAVTMGGLNLGPDQRPSTLITRSSVVLLQRFHTRPAIAAIIPFSASGMLILVIMRALRERGFDPTIIVCGRSTDYTPDPLEDFLADDRLVDLHGIPTHQHIAVLDGEFRARCIELAVLAGGFRALRSAPVLEGAITQAESLRHPV